MPTHFASKTAADASKSLVVVAWLWCRHQCRFGCLLALLLLLGPAVQLFIRVQIWPPPPPLSSPLEQVISPSNFIYLAKSPMVASLSAHVSSSSSSSQQQQQRHVIAAAASTEQPIISPVLAAPANATSVAVAAAEPPSSSAGMDDRQSVSTASLGRVTSGVGSKLVVLFGTTFWGDSFEVFLKSGLPPSARCSRLCELAYDRRRLLDADIVIFHAPELRWQRLPDARRTDQLWALFTLEAPRHGYVSSAHDGVFNLTMTYRSDSDIEVGYGHAELIAVAVSAPDNRSSSAVLPPPMLPSIANAADFAKRKPYAYWMVSNCADPRMAYVRELAKHIRVDVFGKCGPPGLRSCTSSHNATVESKCEAELSENYAFYLAFENSLCTDYVTEKLWRTLASSGGAIPVVIGAPPSRYAQVVPPGSYIHAESFASPSDLAAHLTRVASSRDMFASYHRWRRSYRAHFGWFNEFALGVCRLCESAHDGVWRPSRPAKPDLSSWFSSGCRSQWPHEQHPRG